MNDFQIKEKVAEIFRVVNNIPIFDNSDVKITHLSGISNQTFKCSLDLTDFGTRKKLQSLLEENYESNFKQSLLQEVNEKNSKTLVKIRTCSEGSSSNEELDSNKSTSNSSKHSNANSNTNNGIISKYVTVTDFVFKVFGRISVIVDRELENKIIHNLNKDNKGPKILATDYKLYRAEEFIHNSRNITQVELFEEDLIQQIKDLMVLVNSYGDHQKYFAYLNYLSKPIVKGKEMTSLNSEDQLNSNNQHKNTLVKDLCNRLLKENTSNVFNFSWKMRELAIRSLDEFEREVILDKDFWLDTEYLKIYEGILSVREKLNSCIDTIIDFAPKYPVFVLSHNDAHPCNIMINDKRSVFLIDHEYCGYNFLGFDISNFLLESIFKLDYEEYPFYKQFAKFDTYFKPEYFAQYKSYIEMFFGKFQDKISNQLTQVEGLNFEDLKDDYLKENTYLDLLCMSSVYWFIYAIIYFKYEDFKFRRDFDYFSYSQVRYSVIDYVKAKTRFSKSNKKKTEETTEEDTLKTLQEEDNKENNEDKESKQNGKINSESEKDLAYVHEECKKENYSCGGNDFRASSIEID